MAKKIHAGGNHDGLRRDVAQVIHKIQETQDIASPGPYCFGRHRLQGRESFLEHV